MRHSGVLLPDRRVAIMRLLGVSAAPKNRRRRHPTPLHFKLPPTPLSTQRPAICGFPRQPQGKLWLRARIPAPMIDDGMIPVAAADGRPGPVDEGDQIARLLHQAVTDSEVLPGEGGGEHGIWQREVVATRCCLLACLPIPILHRGEGWRCRHGQPAQRSAGEGRPRHSFAHVGRKSGILEASIPSFPGATHTHTHDDPLPSISGRAKASQTTAPRARESAS